MSKDNFNEWYKDSFEQLREEPPADVWNNIQSELDVEDVWTRVDRRLTFFNRRSVLLKWGAGIAAALLISGGALWMNTDLSSADRVAQKASRYNYMPAALNGTPGNTDNLGSDSRSKPKDEAGSTSMPGASRAKDGNRGSSSSKLTASSNPGSDNNKSINNIVDPLATAALGLTASELEYQEMLSFFLTENIRDNALASSFDPAMTPDSILKARTLRGFGLGALTSFNNTWILNSTTYAGLKARGLYRSRISMASSYGINATYDLNPVWGMEAAFMSSVHRQVYSYFNRAGEYHEKTNTLEYLQGTFLVKKKKPVFCGGQYRGITRTLALGPTFRHLYKAVDETNGLAKGASYQYAESDYGLTVDYGYDIPVFGKMMVSPGITGYAGAKNISRGKLAEPSDFNRTHNTSIGLRMGLRYIFTAK